MLLLAALALLMQDPNEPRVVFGTTVVIPTGLEARVYHLKKDAKKLPNFKRMKPVGRPIYTSTLNVPIQNFRQGFPGVTKRFEWFALDYHGHFWIEKGGFYRFSLLSDDGANLWIDGVLVIDNDGVHAAHEEKGDCQLTHGVHDIRVSYFQGPGVQIALVLKIAPPGEALRIFDTNILKPPPEP